MYGFAYPWFFAGMTLIAGISFLDDVRPRPAKWRLGVHFVAMGLMFYEGGLFAGSPWWYILVALVLFTGIINAYNFMDGINGITGGYSVVVLGALAFINARVATFIDADLLWVGLLSVLVFNLYNFRKQARCFAGDVGAVSMAFLVVFALGRLMLVTGDLTYIVLLLVYGVDSAFTIAHRILLHENIFKAHRMHVYQLMANELHIPHLRVSGIYMLLQTLLILGYLLLPNSLHWLYLWGTFALLAAAYLWFMKRNFKLHRRG